MPTISISDSLSANINISPSLTSSITKYFSDELKVGFKDLDFAHIQNRPVNALPPGGSAIGLTVAEPVDIGIPDAQLKLSAGGSAALAVLLARDNATLANDVFGDALVVGDAEAYVLFTFTVNVAADLSDKQNDLKFGFNASSQIQLTNARRFGLRPAPPTLLSAVTDTLANFVVPGDINDLGAIPPGSVCTVQGTGKLKFSGAFEVDFLANPLATVALPIMSPIQVKSGGSATIAASVTLSADYQIRVTKPDDNSLRVGVYRKRASEFDVSVTTALGLSASLGSTDLIETLIGQISPDPAADQQALKSAGMDTATIGAINSAVKAGIQRRLELAAKAEFTASAEQSPAFLFDVSLPKLTLDAASRSALNAALEGDFSAIDDGLTAITVVRSIKRTMAQQKHSLTLNLLGIYNFVHVSTLIAEGTVLVEPQTGSLIITDKASATRVQASSSTVEADPEKLRTLYADSFMITAAYRGSRNTVGDPALTSAHLFFENHKNTNRQAMKDMLQIAIAMGLLSDTDAAHDLDDLDDFGASSTFAENRYDETLCKMLFLRGAQSRAQAEYETAGRAAILRLVAPGDPDEFRRIPALRDDVWNQLRTIGNVAVFSQVLAGLNSVQVSTIGADYLTIIWWAQSMSAMAQVVAQCEAFFAANPSADVNDHQFTALRQKLAKQISNVVANTRSEFGRPWGLIAMDQILSPRSKARVQISSKAFSFSGERQVSK